MRVNQLQKHDAYITVKDPKDSFPHNPSFRLINPSKPDIGKVSKTILDRMNREITSIQVNQWKNSLALIKWFRNTENKPHCSFIIFNIKDFYPSIHHCLTEQLNLEKKSTVSQIMKFPSSCNQGKHYYSVMVNHGLKKMIRMISMYQWAATIEQRFASWLAYICQTNWR